MDTDVVQEPQPSVIVPAIATTYDESPTFMPQNKNVPQHNIPQQDMLQQNMPQKDAITNETITPKEEDEPDQTSLRSVQVEMTTSPNDLVEPKTHKNEENSSVGSDKVPNIVIVPTSSSTCLSTAVPETNKILQPEVYMLYM